MRDPPAWTRRRCSAGRRGCAPRLAAPVARAARDAGPAGAASSGAALDRTRARLRSSSASCCRPGRTSSGRARRATCRGCKDKLPPFPRRQPRRDRRGARPAASTSSSPSSGRRWPRPRSPRCTARSKRPARAPGGRGQGAAAAASSARSSATRRLLLAAELVERSAAARRLRPVAVRRPSRASVASRWTCGWKRRRRRARREHAQRRRLPGADGDLGAHRAARADDRMGRRHPLVGSARRWSAAGHDPGAGSATADPAPSCPGAARRLLPRRPAPGQPVRRSDGAGARSISASWGGSDRPERRYLAEILSASSARLRTGGRSAFRGRLRAGATIGRGLRTGAAGRSASRFTTGPPTRFPWPSC